MPDSAALPMAPSGVQAIPHHLIDTAPLNPRKAIAADELAQLADSIVAHGLLQNVVLRPHPAKPGRFELVAGERRWRAACLAVRDKRLPADFALPAAIRAVSDAELLLLATAENVARADLSPLEEARAFKALIEQHKVAKADLARRVGRTIRHVELRLALVDKLAQPAQQALAAGAISLAQARVIAQAPKDRQEAIVKAALPRKDGRMQLETAAELRRAVNAAQVPVAAALFPLDLYKGEILTDDDDPKRLMFADVAQFERLQKDAIAALKAKLRETWPWVDVVEAWTDHRGELNRHVGWPYGQMKHKNAGALILVPRRADEAAKPVVVDGMVKLDDPTKGGKASRGVRGARAASKPDKAKERERKAAEDFALWCRIFKTHQLQRWLLANPRIACGLALPRFDAGGGTLDMHGCDEAPEVSAAMKRLGLQVNLDDEATVGKFARDMGAKRDERDAVAAVATMFAASAGVPSGEAYGGNRTLGDSESAVIVLRAVGFDPLKGWTMTREFLDACPVGVLERIASDVLGDHLPAAPHRNAWSAAILKSPRAKTYRPPWLELGTSADLVARLKQATGAQAATAKAPKGKRARAKKGGR